MNNDRLVIVGRRDTATPYQRSRALEPKWRQDDPKGPRRLSMLASTADAVDWGGFREILVHEAGSIDFAAARALLINHDPNRIAGALGEKRIGNDGLEVDALPLAGAKMESGVSVEDAIDAGALRGVSVGYSYRMGDTDWNDETRTLTVRKWRLLEVSLTPIPADDSAALRSADVVASIRSHHNRATAPAKESTMDLKQWLASRGYDIDKLTPAEVAKARKVMEAEGELAGTFAPHARTADEGARAAELVTARAERDAAKRESNLRALAGDHNIDVKDVDFSKFADEAAGTRELLKRKAAAAATPIPTQTAISTVQVDQLDKARDAFQGALSHQVGGGIRDAFKAEHANNPLIGRGFQHMVRGFARLMGVDTADWSRMDVAYFASGRREMMSATAQRAANVITASFPTFVFLNAITKIVARGYEMGAATSRYRRIVDIQRVPDFKQFSVGALGTGNLQKTAEGAAFPELDKSEGVYNSTVKMWGGTVSLSFQAMVNDDTGQFDRILRQAGALADKTIDRRVFQKLLMGTSAAEDTSTWTSNTTSGGSLVYTTADLMAAARGKLGLVRAALGNKVGLDGNPTGNMPRFLVVPLTREVEARGIVGPLSPGFIGSGAGPTGQPTESLEVIATPWLEASALIGASATSYYLLSDPLEVTTLILSYIQGLDTVQVTPYDQGAVAALGWKLWLPAEADLHWIARPSDAVKVIAGAQQGTT